MQNRQPHRRFSGVEALALASCLLVLPHLVLAEESPSAGAAPLGRTRPSCGESAGSKSGLGYLSADERMELTTGLWGRAVHPLGPSFYRYQREKREQGSLTSGCRKKLQKESSFGRSVEHQDTN